MGGWQFIIRSPLWTWSLLCHLFAKLSIVFFLFPKLAELLCCRICQLLLFDSFQRQKSMCAHNRLGSQEVLITPWWLLVVQLLTPPPSLLADGAECCPLSFKVNFFSPSLIFGVNSVLDGTNVTFDICRGLFENVFSVFSFRWFQYTCRRSSADSACWHTVMSSSDYLFIFSPPWNVFVPSRWSGLSGSFALTLAGRGVCYQDRSDNLLINEETPAEITWNTQALRVR